MAVAVTSLFTSCESDHEVIVTDWTSLETVDLQDEYNKFMPGKWEYVYEDSIHFIELYYTFSAEDSLLTGYYNELIRTSVSPDGIPEHDEWQLLWQGSFTAKWVLLHSVDLNQAYIYLDNLKYENVHGALSAYDVMAERLLFYGATKSTLTLTTPLTFRRVDMLRRTAPRQ
jgi:hypothetical protein